MRDGVIGARPAPPPPLTVLRLTSSYLCACPSQLQGSGDKHAPSSTSAVRNAPRGTAFKAARNRRRLKAACGGAASARSGLRSRTWRCTQGPRSAWKRSRRGHLVPAGVVSFPLLGRCSLPLFFFSRTLPSTASDAITTESLPGAAAGCSGGSCRWVGHAAASPVRPTRPVNCTDCSRCMPRGTPPRGPSPDKLNCPLTKA